MSFRNLVVLKVSGSVVVGILFLLVPSRLMSLIGLTIGPGGILMARLYAASLLGTIVLAWSARNAEDSQIRRSIALGLFTYNAIGLLVFLATQLSGVVNFRGWVLVAGYLLFALGFGYLRVMGPSTS